MFGKKSFLSKLTNKFYSWEGVMKNRREVKNKRLKYLRKLSEVRPDFHEEAGQLDWEDFIIELGKHGCFQSPITFDNLLYRVQQTKDEYRKMLMKEYRLSRKDLGSFAPRFRSNTLERAKVIIKWAIQSDIIFFFQTIEERDELLEVLIEQKLISNEGSRANTLASLQKSLLFMKVKSYYPWLPLSHSVQKFSKNEAIQSLRVAKDLFVQYPEAKNPWSPLTLSTEKFVPQISLIK